MPEDLVDLDSDGNPVAPAGADPLGEQPGGLTSGFCVGR